MSSSDFANPHLLLGMLLWFDHSFLFSFSFFFFLSSSGKCELFGKERFSLKFIRYVPMQWFLKYLFLFNYSYYKKSHCNSTGLAIQNSQWITLDNLQWVVFPSHMKCHYYWTQEKFWYNLQKTRTVSLSVCCANNQSICLQNLLCV